MIWICLHLHQCNVYIYIYTYRGNFWRTQLTEWHFTCGPCVKHTIHSKYGWWVPVILVPYVPLQFMHVWAMFFGLAWIWEFWDHQPNYVAIWYYLYLPIFRSMFSVPAVNVKYIKVPKMEHGDIRKSPGRKVRDTRIFERQGSMVEPRLNHTNQVVFMHVFRQSHILSWLNECHVFSFNMY